MVLWTALFLAGSAEVLAAVFHASKERPLASSLLAASTLPIVALVLADMFELTRGGSNVGPRNQDALDAQLLVLGLSAFCFWRFQRTIFWLTWGANLCWIATLIYVALTSSIPLFGQLATSASLLASRFLSRARIKAMAATTLLTSEQFLALPDELDEHGNVVHQELINGEVVSMPHAAARHDIIRSNVLEARIGCLLGNRGLGLKALPDAQFVGSANNAFVPDTSVLTISRLGSEHKYVPGAPELAIEVVSPGESASHLKTKIDAYLANGSRSVWVFPDARSVMVHTADSVREVKADQTLQDSFLPGFSVPVAQFFELT